MTDDDTQNSPRESVELSEGFHLVKRMVSPHLVPFIVSVAGAAVFAGGTVLSTIVLGRVTDDVVLAATGDGPPPPTRTLLIGMAVVFGVALVRAAGVVARRYYAGMTAERVQREIRDALAGEYLARPMAWHHTRATGRLLAHVDSDANVLVHALHPLPFSLGVGFLVFFAGITFWLIDPLVFLVAMLVFPIMVLANRIYSDKIHTPMAIAQERVGEASAIAHESFEGALVVKSLGLASREEQRFSRASERIRDQRVRVGYLRATFDAVIDALPSLGILTVVAFGAVRIRAGSMSPGDIVTVTALFTVLAIPMRVFGFFLESLAPSLVAWDRLDPIIGNARENVRHFASSGSVDREKLAGSQRRGGRTVTVSDVTFAYPIGVEALLDHDIDPAAIAEGSVLSETIIDGASFELRAGETVALVGATGSGKSTLCALVAGVTTPLAGHVLIDGSNVADLSTVERANDVALVFQEPFVFADTVRSNIDINGTASQAQLERAADQAQIREFIDELPDGWDTELGERGFSVSGGQRQRLALARALVRQPGLLILDDATSAVDSVIEQEILEALRAGGGATTLIVAHRLSTILLADRVLYLRQGRVVADGTHQELLKDEAYRNLVSAYSQAGGVS